MILQLQRKREKKKGKQRMQLGQKYKQQRKKESKTETKKEYTVCSLAIRCPNGKTIKHDFAPNDTLKTVYDYLRTEGGLTGDFIISTNYPRIAYTGEKLNITLEYADLVPRAALTVSYK